ncbi:transposase [Streptomyces massasporeus]|uniref:transposase n=1 Tax=Streptomyces massasporeus TaxID=67324 RepID=UPI0034D79EC9
MVNLAGHAGRQPDHRPQRAHSPRRMGRPTRRGHAPRGLLTDTPDGKGSLLSGGPPPERTPASRTASAAPRPPTSPFPSRHFQINASRLGLSVTAVDLRAWARALLPNGELATGEPKKLRHRLLHAAARITGSGRRLHLWIAVAWPWRFELANALARLAVRPRPATCTATLFCPPLTRGTLENATRASGPSHARLPTIRRRPQQPTQPSRPNRKGGG